MKIETERLIIRKLIETDLPEFKETLNEAQLSVMSPKDFLGWLISQYSKMDILNDLICFGIFDKDSGCLLGTAGVGKHDDLHEPEIFYTLLSKARGKGYATEATKSIIHWAFKKYHIPYIIGTAEVSNIESQNVLERCGFKLIDERPLLVHVERKKYNFKYYRYYPVD